MASMRDAKIVKTEILGNKYKRIVREFLHLSDGAEFDWIYLDKPKSLAIVALTPARELVLVKLYRYTLKKDVCELPAGEMDTNDSTPLATAKRELEEETGYTSDAFVDLGEYYVMPSETNRSVHFFLALDATQAAPPKLDNIVEKYFDMSVTTLPLSALAMPQQAAEHGMTGLESLFGLQLAQQYLAHQGSGQALHNSLK
jgi:8-oxo-dGTP pyrophosphatase MutT (NUDIX family)